METTAVQSLKLAIVSATGLSKDALHIYVGITVFLVAGLALRKYMNTFFPVAAVVAVACIGVVAQMPVAAEVGSGDERDELGSG